MHRVLLPFEFAEPGSVGEAAALVDGQEARVLAGGVDLVLKMRLRQITPKRVVSLQKVPGLGSVEADAAGLRFGALATLRQIERAAAVIEGWPLLAEAIGSIVSIQTKVMGTAVGNLCVGTPASDVAPALYALGARVRIAGTGGDGSVRELPIEEFFVDNGRTVVGPHEIVTEIFVPRAASGTVGSFLKLSKTAEDIAKVNVAVAVTIAAGRCTDAKIALGSVAPTPVRVAEAEGSLKGGVLDARAMAEAADIAAEVVAPISDVRSTAAYRKEMVRVLVRDALSEAAARALGRAVQPGAGETVSGSSGERGGHA
jgi:carbon-monoxide dehydrogenase medium subunit